MRCPNLLNRVRFAILFFILIISVSDATSAQVTGNSDDSNAVVPEEAMSQVVRTVLSSYFKPKSPGRTVYLDKAYIRKLWLPRISGVQFRLIDSHDSSFSVRHHFRFDFFIALDETSNGQYDIGFAFGCPCSGYKGDLWHIVVKNQKLVSLKKKSDEGYVSSGYDSGPTGPIDK